jgi:hypothetical protein
MDTPYITDRALIGVIDMLITRAYRGEDATLPATFENDPTIVFSLSAPSGLDPATKRPFTWFIRQNAASLAEQLEAARNTARDDGRDRDVDLTGLATERGWPVLRLEVRGAVPAVA